MDEILTGTNVRFTRTLNRRVVIEAVRRHSPISRADLAHHTGLTHQAVSNIVGALLEEGYLRRLGRRHVERGQPPVEFALNPDAAHAIGINLDRDRLVGIRVDLEGRVVNRIETEVDHPGPEQSVDVITRAGRELASDVPSSRVSILGIGLAVPTGKWADPASFPGWHSTVVRNWLERRLGHRVYVENDATAAAIWEHLYGRGREFADFFYIHFGYALGGGVISNGTPLYGAHGNAGEFGFTPVFEDVDAFSHGRSDALQHHVSLSALERWLDDHPEADPVSLTSPAIDSWLTRAARLLVEPILNVDNLFDPSAILLGGRLPFELRAELVRRVEPNVLRRRIPGKDYPVQLLPGAAADDAAALGAATLLLYERLSPSPQLVRKQVAMR